jgi:hypothetical protein
VEDYFDSEADAAEYQDYLDGLRYEDHFFGPRPEIEETPNDGIDRG